MQIATTHMSLGSQVGLCCSISCKIFIYVLPSSRIDLYINHNTFMQVYLIQTLSRVASIRKFRKCFSHLYFTSHLLHKAFLYHNSPINPTHGECSYSLQKITLWSRLFKWGWEIWNSPQPSTKTKENSKQSTTMGTNEPSQTLFHISINDLKHNNGSKQFFKWVLKIK